MKILFSRHATRRTALYAIELGDVVRIIERIAAERELSAGKHITIDEASGAKYGFPVKIVFVVERSETTVVTAYPLKKGVAR